MRFITFTHTKTKRLKSNKDRDGTLKKELISRGLLQSAIATRLFFMLLTYDMIIRVYIFLFFPPPVVHGHSTAIVLISSASFHWQLIKLQILLPLG